MQQGPLCSTGVAPFQCYYEPSRHRLVFDRFPGVCLLFIHLPAHGSEVSPAARNTLDSARIPRASKLLICGLFLKGRVLAQDGVVKQLSQAAFDCSSMLRVDE